VPWCSFGLSTEPIFVVSCGSRVGYMASRVPHVNTNWNQCAVVVATMCTATMPIKSHFSGTLKCNKIYSVWLCERWRFTIGALKIFHAQYTVPVLWHGIRASLLHMLRKLRQASPEKLRVEMLRLARR